jgi:hypothetical protein
MICWLRGVAAALREIAAAITDVALVCDNASVIIQSHAMPLVVQARLPPTHARSGTFRRISVVGFAEGHPGHPG